MGVFRALAVITKSSVASLINLLNLMDFAQHPEWLFPHAYFEENSDTSKLAIRVLRELDAALTHLEAFGLKVSMSPDLLEEPPQLVVEEPPQLVAGNTFDIMTYIQRWLRDSGEA